MENRWMVEKPPAERLQPGIDPHGTHLPLLLRAVALTGGPVLEIGCGTYSTLMLHEVCRGRRLVSLDTDRGWLSKFKGIGNQSHELRWSNTYDDFDGIIRGETWSVVLVDHAPGERRIVELAKVHGAELVVHDSENWENSGYHYRDEFLRWKNAYFSTRMIPMTVVLSDVRTLEEFAEV